MTRELVRRAIEGDHDAFSSLVDASVDRLYGVATLILRDPDRAQDAVQEALVSAWKDVRALRDPDAWDAWLHRITVWACYRVAKKERRRKEVELTVEQIEEIQSVLKRTATRDLALTASARSIRPNAPS